MEDIKFKPYLLNFKAPVGALKVNEEAIINLHINSGFNIYRLKLVILDDEEDVVLINYLNYKTSVYDGMNYNVYETKFSLDKPYIYHYYFEFSDCYGEHFIIPNGFYDGVLSDSLTKTFQVNVINDYSPSLSWYKGKVMYQIIIDRFNRSKELDQINMDHKYNYLLHEDFNEHVLDKPYKGDYHVDFFGGDINGLIQKLDYLKGLNVGVLYLNPIFLSPTSHKYNTSDYLMIDPMYGTKDDFINLVNEAKKKGISIILDGVFNHTGDDSIYFNKYHHFNELGAYESIESKYYSWYDFDEYPKKYRSWWGISTLPSVNQNSGFVDFITGSDGVIDTWMKTGIKGFRLDVVDEINDNFVTKINNAIRRVDNDGIVIGEVWEDASNKMAYGTRRKYFIGNELDSVMNYELKNGIIDYLRNNHLDGLVQVTRRLLNNYPKDKLDLMMNILSTHDTYRIMTMLSGVDEFTVKDKLHYKLSRSDYSLALSKSIMAFTILYTMPGIPCIYYGDDVSMEGFGDPYSREAMKWDKVKRSKINKCLVNLGSLRNNKVYIDGIYKEEHIDDNVFVFSRSNDNTKAYTIINNGNNSFNFTFSNEPINCYIYKINELRNSIDKINDINVLANSCVVIIINK